MKKKYDFKNQKKITWKKINQENKEVIQKKKENKTKQSHSLNLENRSTGTKKKQKTKQNYIEIKTYLTINGDPRRHREGRRQGDPNGGIERERDEMVWTKRKGRNREEEMGKKTRLGRISFKIKDLDRRHMSTLKTLNVVANTKTTLFWFNEDGFHEV